MSYDFDADHDPRGSGSTKWDAMPDFFGEAARDALPMWVAQTDFPAPPFLQRAALATVENGQYGYFVDAARLLRAASAWQERLHGWAPDPEHGLPTHGLGNAIGICLQALSDPGDGVIIFTPVYHEFTNKIRRNGREVVESPLIVDENGLFQMDLPALEARLTGRERIMLISAPHNPAGRIWTREEMRDMAEFCARHDMILISDEIHSDLILPGHKHLPAALAAPEQLDRMVILLAASKTFDIAGLRTGCLFAPGEAVRNRITTLHRSLDIQPNRFGVELSTAAWSDEGAAWLADLMVYLDGNRQVFEEGIAAIPGVTTMPMQATFLAWVNFSGTGMEEDEIERRIREEARILPSPGPAFGTGGAQHARFNLGTSRARVREAVARLQAAFADLQ